MRKPRGSWGETGKWTESTAFKAVVTFLICGTFAESRGFRGGNENLWEIVASSPFLGPSLARSRKFRFACPNRRACLQAFLFPILHSSIPALGTLWLVFFGSWRQPRQLLSFAHVGTKKTHSERVKPSYTTDFDILTFFMWSWRDIWQTVVFVKTLTGSSLLSSRGLSLACFFRSSTLTKSSYRFASNEKAEALR